jgi:acyl carrier protein
MALAQRAISMRSTFDTIADIITLTCSVPREQITPDSSLLNDLGIDSLELLDVKFAIDDAFSITMPIDQWLQAVLLPSRTTPPFGPHHSLPAT